MKSTEEESSTGDSIRSNGAQNFLVPGFLFGVIIVLTSAI